MSPDMNVLDYFLWDHWSRAVCARNPTNLLELRAAIVATHSELDRHALQRAIVSPARGFVGRCRAVVALDGARFEHRLE